MVVAEPTHSLALGIEPREALRGSRLTHPVRIDVEFGTFWSPRGADEPFGLGRESWRRRRRGGAILNPHLPRVDRHDSGRFALVFSDAVEDPIDLRIYESTRRYVPRRLKVPVPAVGQPLAGRVRRPLLFPGAAYDFSDALTGLRGRVLRGGSEMRWARVEAVHPDTLEVVGRAHGDDRGEFLLLISPAAEPFQALSDPLQIRVVVSGPGVPPTPSSPELPEQDEYWDLPLETVPPPGDPDPVSTGELPPAGYASSLSATRIVNFRHGRILTGRDEPDFVYE